MGTSYMVHGTLLNVIWQPGWKGSLGENGYMYVYGWIPLLFTWNYHDIVNQQYPNTNKVSKKGSRIFEGASLQKWFKIKESTCNAGDPGSILGQEGPLEKGMTTTPVSLLRESHGQRGLVGYSPLSHKEKDPTEQLTHTHTQDLWKGKWVKSRKFLAFLFAFLVFPKWSDQIRSVAQSCPALCDPMNRSTPGLPVPHQLPEFTQVKTFANPYSVINWIALFPNEWTTVERIKTVEWHFLISHNVATEANKWLVKQSRLSCQPRHHLSLLPSGKIILFSSRVLNELEPSEFFKCYIIEEIHIKHLMIIQGGPLWEPLAQNSLKSRGLTRNVNIALLNTYAALMPFLKRGDMGTSCMIHGTLLNYMADWMEGKFGGEWIHVHVWLNPFTIHLKLHQ